MMSPPTGTSEYGRERPWIDDVTAVENRPDDSVASLVSLAFITAAMRRGAWLWRVLAIVGLLAGSGLYLRIHQSYQASTSLLLTVGAESQPGTAILNDQALVHSHTVAGLALHELGMQQSVSSFLGSYSATPVTDRVLLITASASSNKEAVRRANALATEFLTFRADQLLAQQRLEFTALDQQVTQDKQSVASINQQIRRLSAQPASPAQRAELSALRVQGDRANSELTALQQTATATRAASKVATATIIGGSEVLDAASPIPIAPHSHLKHLALYAGGGFIIGLILGLSIVILRALLSDRLRRRDDVAQALAVPVRSVPAVRVGRGRAGGRRGASGYYVQRIADYLREAVPAGARRGVALAVVPVGDPRVAAQSVVSLAVSCAEQGRRVVVADLSSGAPAAMLLGAGAPGVHTVSVDRMHLAVAIPDPADFAPVGPFRPVEPPAQPAAGELAAACASADLVLTLIPLDPSVGGEHLATWAADAVVVVTAGRSSWTKIHAVGEMIRLAGTRLVCAVLVGADQTDESLGAAPRAGRDAVTTQGAQADGDGSFAPAPGRRPPDEGAPGMQMHPPEHLGHRQRTGR